MSRHWRWVSPLMCRVFVTGLPLMPAVTTIVTGILLAVVLYGAHLWAGTELVPLEPQRAEAHQPVVQSADVISHDSRTVQLRWTGGTVFSQVRVRFIAVLPYTWSSPLPALGTRDFIVPGDQLSVRYEMQGCEAANFNNGTCSLWHNHLASGTVTFLERPTIVNWSVSPVGTVNPTDNISFAYRATNSTRIVITRNNLDYISGLDGNDDLIVATVNPHIRNLPVGTHTFRLTAYRFVSATNEEVSTESPDVFIVTVEEPVTPPTVVAPTVPDLTDLEVVCSLTGTNQTQAHATWNAPSGTLPAGVRITGYSVLWSNLDDLENPTETMMVTVTSATLLSLYAYGDLAHVRVRVVYSWTGSSQDIYTTGQTDTCNIPTPGVTPPTVPPTTEVPPGVTPPTLPPTTEVPPGVTPPTDTHTPTTRPTTRVPLPLVVTNIIVTCNYPDVTISWDAFEGSFDNYRVRYRRYNLDDYTIHNGVLPTGYHQIANSGTDNSITIRGLNDVGYRPRTENYGTQPGDFLRRDIFRTSVQIEDGGDSSEWFHSSSCIFTPPEGPPISGLHFSDCSTGRSVGVAAG